MSVRAYPMRIGDVMLDEAEIGLALREQMRAMLVRSAVADLGGVGWLEATGEDRVRWLNGMVTNSIQGMTPGQGSYSFLLNAQGRIQGELTAFAEADRLLLEVDRVELDRVRAWLDRYIIMDDVELRVAEEMQAGLQVTGPEAVGLLQQIGVTSLPVAELGIARSEWKGTEVFVVRAWSPLMPTFEVWTDAGTARTLRQAVVEAGAVRCGAEALHALRILEGRPRWGVDIRDRELAQETGQTRALHFSKGCYLGQEIVERVRSRGAVHRTFVGFVLRGEMPGEDRQIFAADKAVGELSSVVQLPGWLLGLGYVRREAAERDPELHYAGGVARVTEIPFREAAGALAQESGASGTVAASEE